MEAINGALAGARLEGCSEQGSGSPFSDSIWFKEERNSNLSRLLPSTVNLEVGGAGFKLSR